jgi:outer membrane biosynthesis protein TonB/flagellar basal body-associated protein FliL
LEDVFPEEDAEILELTSDQQIPSNTPEEKEIPSTPSKKPSTEDEKENFQPIIEINFDDDNAETPPKKETHSRRQMEPINVQPEPPIAPPSIATQFNDSAEEEIESKKKKTLLIVALIAILILVAAIVYFLVINSSSEPAQPITGEDSATVSGLQSSEQEIPPPLPQTETPLTTTEDQGDQHIQPSTQTDQTDQKDQTITDTDPATKSSEPAPQEPTTASRKEESEKSGKQKQKKQQNREKEPEPEKSKPLPTATKNQPESTEFTPPTTPTPGKTTQKEKPLQTNQTDPPVTEKKEEASGNKSFVPAVQTIESNPKPAISTNLQDTKKKDEATQKSETAGPPKKVSTIKEGDILSPNEVDTKVIPISTPAIKISRSIRRLMMSNQRVLVSYLIDHKGNVEIVKLIKKSRMKKLNELISDSIKKWKFKPATKNNVKVKVWKNGWITIKK